MELYCVEAEWTLFKFLTALAKIEKKNEQIQSFVRAQHKALGQASNFGQFKKGTKASC